MAPDNRKIQCTTRLGAFDEHRNLARKPEEFVGFSTLFRYLFVRGKIAWHPHTKVFLYVARFQRCLYGKPYWTKVVKNNFVGWEVILSFEMYFQWSRNILMIEKTFSLVEKTFSLMRNICGKSRNILKDQEKFFIGQQFFIGWEFFGRLRINFVYLKFFCWSRIFLQLRIYLTVENFFLSIENCSVNQAGQRVFLCQNMITWDNTWH